MVILNETHFSKALILFAHGSKDLLWRRSIDDLALRIRLKAPDIYVSSAFLEFIEPDLPKLVNKIISLNINYISISPIFLGLGKHVRNDLPSLFSQIQLEHPNIIFKLQGPIGENPKLIDLMAKIALETFILN